MSLHYIFFFLVNFTYILQEIVDSIQHQRSSSNFYAWFIELGWFSIVTCLYFKYYWVPTLTFWHTIFSSTLTLQFIYSPHARMETNSQCNQTLKAYSDCTTIFWANHILNGAFWTVLHISLWYSFDMTFPFSNTSVFFLWCVRYHHTRSLQKLTEEEYFIGMFIFAIQVSRALLRYFLGNLNRKSLKPR